MMSSGKVLSGEFILAVVGNNLILNVARSSVVISNIIVNNRKNKRTSPDNTVPSEPFQTTCPVCLGAAINNPTLREVLIHDY